MANARSGASASTSSISRANSVAPAAQSKMLMDRVGQVPRRSDDKVSRREQHLEPLGQEVGHRWLAYLNFRDHPGQRSEELLGRDKAHWSFFMDSDASVMEGNDIEGSEVDRSGRSARCGYSRLDQYAMGLVVGRGAAVLLRGSPTNLSQTKDKESAPQVGVTFNGTRRDVLIDDVIAIDGSAGYVRRRGPRACTVRHSSIVSGRGPPDSGAGRKARSNPPPVGRISGTGDRRPHARRYTPLPVETHETAIRGRRGASGARPDGGRRGSVASKRVQSRSPAPSILHGWRQSSRWCGRRSNRNACRAR